MACFCQTEIIVVNPCCDCNVRHYYEGMRGEEVYFCVLLLLLGSKVRSVESELFYW